MSKSEKQIKQEDLLTRIRREITPIFEKVIVDDEVFFENPHLPHCWEMKDCKKDDCPVHAADEMRCWQVAGTYCGGRVQGSFVDKYEACSVCEVFTDACPTIVEELGEHLNNMLYLLRKKKQQTMKDMERIEYLNRELATSLESLDAKNREIQEMVITDKLTGIYNRHYIFTVLEDEFARHARGSYDFTVLLMDVDDFKSFNDSYGHLEGDKVLVAMGLVFKEVLRKTDRAFRYGGEEFVVVLPDTDMTIAYVIAERIRRNFAERKFTVSSLQGKEEVVSKTISTGIAATESGMDMYGLLARADEAMYLAKSRGKNMSVRYGMDKHP